tara:strand:- start:662 stop:886 length:225 start_codon:yes stop_codon:yes gene_type:complete
MHSLTQNGVTKWVALSEGAGGGVGWLTVRRKRPVTIMDPPADATLCLLADERAEGGALPPALAAPARAEPALLL